MLIQTKEKEIMDSARLHTVSTYAKKIGISYQGVLVKIGSGKLKTTWISGIQFIIHSEGGDNDK